MSTSASSSGDCDRESPEEREAGDPAAPPGALRERPRGPPLAAGPPGRGAAGRPGGDSSRGALAFAVLLALLVAGIPRGKPGSVEPLILGIPLEDPRLLLLLDGAGPSLAGRADAFHRNLQSIERAATLRRVPGIGASLLDAWWPWLESRAPAPPAVPRKAAR